MERNIKPRIVITGVAGFIGSSLAYTLCNLGYEVIGIDNFLCGYESNLNWVDLSHHKFTLHKLSASDNKLLDIIEKGDIVIHLAAFTTLPSNQNDTVFSYSNNVMTTLSLLEMCRTNGIAHFIFASTACVYENNHYTDPIREDTPVNPTLIYSLGKKQCEELIHSYYHNYGVPYTVFRLFNVYGPKADPTRLTGGLIPYLFTKMTKGEPIRFFDNGEQRRDYIYIDDVIDFLIKIISCKPLCSSVNIASGKTISVNEIFNEVKSVLNYSNVPTFEDPSVAWDKIPSFFTGNYPFKRSSIINDILKFTLGDIQRAKSVYDWEPKITFAEGIKMYAKIFLNSVNECKNGNQQ